MRRSNVVAMIVAIVLTSGRVWSEVPPTEAPADVLFAERIIIETADVPALSFLQTPSHLWTLLGSDQSFRLREGSAIVPIEVFAGAPTGSLKVLPNGDVGNVPGSFPLASFHVRRANGTTRLLLQEASPTTQARNMLRVVNNGAATMRFDNTATGTNWGLGSLGTNNFFVAASGQATLALTLTPGGDLSIAGTLSQGSDRDSKTGIAAVEPEAVLAKVAALPIATWRYKTAPAVHVGPMAQDFAAAFGLGADDKHIAPGDMAGISLAAIQALKAENDLLRHELDDLAEQVRALQVR
jgi:Chaperone of endosialidase